MNQAPKGTPEGQPPRAAGGASPFRSEALQHHARGLPLEGSLLQLTPAWTRRAYWVLVASVAMALLLAALATRYEYGRAVLKLLWKTGHE